MALHESNNAVAVTATSQFIRFNAIHQSVNFVDDDAANACYVKVWQEGELPADGTGATITTTTQGVRKILFGESWTVTWDNTAEIGSGYVGFSVIAGGGLTATMRFFAK